MASWCEKCRAGTSSNHHALDGYGYGSGDGSGSGSGDGDGDGS